MASKRNRSRKPKDNAPAGPKLASELFSELNATFYEDDPSQYLLVKIEALTLMLAPSEAGSGLEQLGVDGPVDTGGNEGRGERRMVQRAIAGLRHQ